MHVYNLLGSFLNLEWRFSSVTTAAIEKMYTRPVIHGVAFIISLGGIVFTILRTKGSKPSNPSSDSEHEVDLGEGRIDHHARLKLRESDTETPHSNLGTPKACKFIETEDHELEIKNLKNKVRTLKERGRSLEIQLLEYCGLKEQETVVLELQNQLKLNDVEAKLFALKIEAVQADNRRLEAQVTDSSRVALELEGAKGKIKMLKKKLKSETEQNKEQISNLKQRVRKLQEDGHRTVTNSLDFQLKLEKMEELEEEAEELRKSNKLLKLEKSDLVHKLEYTQMLATTVLDDHETGKLREESRQLKQQNEDLLVKKKQLEADHSADAKDLVYLRWVNACLRCKLRQLKAQMGKTTASDISQTLSSESGKMIKPLMEYSNKEAFTEKDINFSESDFERWSSSQSCVTDSSELDYSSADNSTSKKAKSINKTRILVKLKKLLKRKDNCGPRGNKCGSLMARVASEADIIGHSSNSSRSRISVVTGGPDERLKNSPLVSSASYSNLEILRSFHED